MAPHMAATVFGCPKRCSWRSGSTDQAPQDAQTGKLRQRGFRTALPSIHLANLRSLPNKTDELLLLTRTNKDFSNSAALCFTETWLNDAMPDCALHLPGYQLFRADHDAESTGKSCGGGTCFYINERWCTDVTVLKNMCCSDLEALFINCKPFYSLREFCSFILVSVYIPPQANVSLALQKLADQIADTEQKHPDSVLIILGDFNKANLSLKTVKRWTNETERVLQTCFEWTDWSVFKAAATDLDELTETAKEDAYRKRHRVLYNQARNTLNKEIRAAKMTYAKRLEDQFASNDPTSVWKGLKAITNYKTPSPSTKISEEDVRQVFRKNKRRKAPGPDGVTPACLKTCADHLAPIFSQIFNRSLELCEVPSCFKRSTIIPVPKKPKITGLK
ncbi:putative 149 kDa protein [Labeo rohita]|uniref:149 kDa protein n=1 Tax=Labeo rohita TaxID=84645 RepID=A0ABQ8LKV4_LABRO|nr:putative 149 kDa protein [Labeo rohita]